MINRLRRPFPLATLLAYALGLVCSLLLPGLSEAATVLLSESFETPGEGTRWTSSGEFRESVQTYFMRTNGQQTSGQNLPPTFTSEDRRYSINLAPATYTGMDGSFVWAAENVDGGSGNNANPATVTLNAVNITGYTNLAFTGLFGGTAADTNDYLRVSYSLDGSPTFTPALFFATTTTGTSQTLALDTDNNGRGDAGLGDVNVLGSALKEFGFAIPDAATVTLRVEVFADASADEFAFDFFQLSGDLLPAPQPAPEPATLALIGLAAVGLCRRRCRR